MHFHFFLSQWSSAMVECKHHRKRQNRELRIWKPRFRSNLQRMHTPNIRVTQQGSELLVAACTTAQVTPMIISWVLPCLLKSIESMSLHLISLAGGQIQRGLPLPRQESIEKMSPYMSQRVSGEVTACMWDVCLSIGLPAGGTSGGSRSPDMGLLGLWPCPAPSLRSLLPDLQKYEEPQNTLLQPCTPPYFLPWQTVHLKMNQTESLLPKYVLIRYSVVNIGTQVETSFAVLTRLGGLTLQPRDFVTRPWRLLSPSSETQTMRTHLYDQILQP